MKPGQAACFALAFALPGRHAPAAPMGAGVEAVSVLPLEADRSSDLAAKTLTSALRQTVLDEPEYTLADENPSLILLARDLKCPMGAAGGELPDERAFDDACLRKVGKSLGVSRFFWGYVTAGAGGGTVGRLHFWQRGQPGRVATLPYDAAARDRIAVRLYRKLVVPEKVGDVALAGVAQGELVVDGLFTCRINDDAADCRSKTLLEQRFEVGDEGPADLLDWKKSGGTPRITAEDDVVD